MNTTQKTTQEMSPLDQVLNQTDIGQFIGKYKLLLSLLFGVIIIGVIGQGIYSNLNEKRINAFSAEVYVFQSGPMKDFLAKKIDQNKVLVEYQTLIEKTEGYSGVGLMTLELSQELKKQGNQAQAIKILEEARQTMNNPYVSYFLTSNLAAEYEDNGEWQKAVDLHKSLLDSPVKVYEEKTYLDLGRVYMKLDDKEKAKTSFQQVIDKGKEAELKKLAGLYLEKLK